MPEFLWKSHEIPEIPKQSGIAITKNKYIFSRENKYIFSSYIGKSTENRYSQENIGIYSQEKATWRC